MTRLIRWNPNRSYCWDRDPFELMDRMFGSAMDRDMTEWGNAGSWSFPMDVIEKDDTYVVRASIPGLNPDDLDVTLTDNVLTIHGETHSEDEETSGDRYVMRERQQGSFTRSIRLPMPIEADEIEATCSNGELKLTLPKAETMRPRRIAIGDGGTTRVIDGETSARKRDGQSSKGWVEGQVTKPKADQPKSQGWTEGQTDKPRRKETNGQAVEVRS